MIPDANHNRIMTQTVFEIKALFIQFSIDPHYLCSKKIIFLYFGFLYFYDPALDF